jgi:AraC-like DNA-binding protein
VNVKSLIVGKHYSVAHYFITAPIPMHIHPDYVVSYYFGGASPCKIGPYDCFQFHAGDIGLLNPGEAHEDLSSRIDREYLTIHLDKRIFVDVMSEVGCGTGGPPYFLSHKERADPFMERVCRSLCSELNGQEWGRALLIESLITEVVIRLIRGYTPEAYRSGMVLSFPHPPIPHWRVRKAIEYLCENYMEQFSLDQLSAAAGLSKYYLVRTFKKMTGVSPHSYAMMLRLEKTKRLLANSSKPIAEIAIEMGFSDHSHFCCFFKKHTGMTPQAFRLGSK